MKKKLTTLITCIALLSTASLPAEETVEAAAPTPIESNGNWENLIFSAITLFTAIIGITVVSINNGSSGTSD